MDAVPDRIGWRFGLTYLQPLLTVLPGKQTTFDADLKTALNQHYAGGGTVPGLLGEAFANFGPLGWFLVPFLVGMAITALYRKTREGAPELIVLYAYAIIHVSIGGILERTLDGQHPPVRGIRRHGLRYLRPAHHRASDRSPRRMSGSRKSGKSSPSSGHSTLRLRGDGLPRPATDRV